MMYYVVAVILSLICASYAANVKKVNSLQGTYRTLCVLAFLPMTFVSVFRYEVGTDWPIYDEYFHKIDAGIDKFTEPGFNLLNKVISVFTKDSWWLFAACALIIGVFMFKAIMDQSVNPAFSILVYVLAGDYFNSQNQLRQAIAMSIFLYAFKYVKARDWKRYFFWMLIASTIHLSAVLYFPVYFLYGVKVCVPVICYSFAGLCVLLPVLKKLLVFVVSKTKYSWYFDSAYYASNFNLVGFLVSLGFLVLLLFYYAYYDKHSKLSGENGEGVQDKEYNLLLYIYFAATISTLFSSAIPQMSRITILFSFVTSLLFPRMVMREHRRNRRIVLYMIVVGVLAVKFLYEVCYVGWYDAVPFKWVFFR